jgi:DNA-binding NarL/FixJ family response regulator
MDGHSPMPLLLIEDDITECVKFKRIADNRSDITFVGITDSGAEGLQYVKAYVPEGVILDLELHKGKGTGLQFLAELNDVSPARRPIVIVTTNTPSGVVYSHVHDIGADLIFYKRQDGYSPDLVVNTMLALRKSHHAAHYNDVPRDLQTIEAPDVLSGRIKERINDELDNIGINVKYKGRAYLHDAIYILLTKDKNTSEAVIYQVAESNSLSYSSIIRAVQTAINSAWNRTAIKDLQAHYTARVNIHTGVPSPTDLIHYYADKIRKSM